MNKLDYDVGDLLRIQDVLLAHNIEATLHECDELWEKYSEHMCASYMNLPVTMDGIWQCVIDFIGDEYK